MADLMQQARELLPCPFCGGEAERIDFGPGDAENEGGSCIACRRCQASGPVEFSFKENFIANWNRRAALRAAPEGYVLVPVEPTPERMAAAALAVLTPANGDIELARRAAQIVIQSANAPHGITVDMIAASIATMAPAYRAMTAARPQGVR